MKINYRSVGLFVKLIADCKAVPSLHHHEVHFDFPVDKSLDNELKVHNAIVADEMTSAEQSPVSGGIRDNRVMGVVIRGLATNPQFIRVTTFAHHATQFAFELTGYGRMRCKKKAGSPFSIICETRQFAKKLFLELT